MVENEIPNEELNEDIQSAVIEELSQEGSDLSPELASVFSENFEPSEEDESPSDESSDDSRQSDDALSSAAEVRQHPGAHRKQSKQAVSARIGEFKRLAREADDRAYDAQMQLRGLKQEYETLMSNYENLLRQHETYVRDTDMVIQNLEHTVYGNAQPNVAAPNGLNYQPNGLVSSASSVSGNARYARSETGRYQPSADLNDVNRPLTRADFDRMREEEEGTRQRQQIVRNWDEIKQNASSAEERDRIKSALRKAAQDSIDHNPAIAGIIGVLSRDKKDGGTILRALQNRTGNKSYTRMTVEEMMEEAMNYKEQIVKNRNTTTRSTPAPSPRSVPGNAQESKKNTAKPKGFSDYINQKISK